MNLWEKIDVINDKLKENFLIIPFCYNVNGKYVEELMDAYNANEQLEKYVFDIVTSPYARTYQMEYRYKHMDVFKPFLKLIECVNYDLFSGNITCAYLSLIPIVEAVLIKWKKKIPTITTNKIRASIPGFIEQWKNENNEKIYNNEKLKKCFEYEIDYMEYTLNLFYQDFDSYKDNNFSDTFNRNLSLHKLEGISNDEEIYRNLNRLFLLIDVIADLYTLADDKEDNKGHNEKYFRISFYADPQNDKDFQMRWSYYNSIKTNKIISNYINILKYNYINKHNEKNR